MANREDGYVRRHGGALVTAMAEQVRDRKEWVTEDGPLPADVWYGYSLVVTHDKQVFPGGTSVAATRDAALEDAITRAVQKIDEAARMLLRVAQGRFDLNVHPTPTRLQDVVSAILGAFSALERLGADGSQARREVRSAVEAAFAADEPMTAAAMDRSCTSIGL